MLNQKKNEEKTKRKSPNPTLGGMKSILARKSKEKVRDKHKWSLVLKSLKHLLSLQNIISS